MKILAIFIVSLISLKAMQTYGFSIDPLYKCLHSSNGKYVLIGDLRRESTNLYSVYESQRGQDAHELKENNLALWEYHPQSTNNIYVKARALSNDGRCLALAGITTNFDYEVQFVRNGVMLTNVMFDSSVISDIVSISNFPILKINFDANNLLIEHCLPDFKTYNIAPPRFGWHKSLITKRHLYVFDATTGSLNVSRNLRDLEKTHLYLGGREQSRKTVIMAFSCLILIITTGIFLKFKRHNKKMENIC